METALSRMMLAASILLAAALGVVLGGWLTGSLTHSPAAPTDLAPLALPMDMALAGVAACGFGAFYNAPWRVLRISILGGMVGHGIRFLMEQQGAGLALATLMACLIIGVIAGFAVDRLRVPFSAVAFAGAVPMMPGVFIYESIGGAMRMAATGKAADPELAAATMALAFKAVFVVGAMAVGLLVGARVARRAAGLTRPQP
jgi:uncharacterized membrane protein YjjB (DUF3815 family)